MDIKQNDERTVTMKGLIIKDFINLKKSLKMFLIMSVLYFFIAINTDNPYFFTSMLAVLLTITTISLFAFDEMAKWDVYALTMPLDRRKIIQARYLTMLLLTLTGAALSVALTIIISLYLKNDLSADEFINIGYGALIIIVIMSTLMPFVIKMGVERARLIFVVLYILPFMLIIMVKKMLDKQELAFPDWLKNLTGYVMKNLYIILPLAVLLVLLVSYSISVSIYKKKDL